MQSVLLPGEFSWIPRGGEGLAAGGGSPPLSAPFSLGISLTSRSVMSSRASQLNEKYHLLTKNVEPLQFMNHFYFTFF